MRSTHNSYLPLTQIYLPARRVHILPEIKDCRLIYVGKLFDDRFAVNFEPKNVFLWKVKHVLIG